MMPTFLQLIVRSLTFHRRMHAAVALGVAAATAVLTGALLVGDSVRGSLRDLVLDRLGRVDDLIATDRFFRAALVDDLRAGDSFQRQYDMAVGIGLLPGGTLEKPAGDDSRRASNVLVIGSNADFWDLGPSDVRPRSAPGLGQVVLNQPLADELQARVGDKLVLRLPSAHQVPADSPLGKKTDRIQSLADLEVVDVVPAQGLGRFGLQSTQHLPRNAYIALESLQNALDQPERINAILLAAKNPGERRDTSQLIRPQLADLGLHVHHVRQEFLPGGKDSGGKDSGGADSAGAAVKTPDVVFDYFQVSSDRLMIDSDAVDEVRKAWADLSPQIVLTYLANLIEKADSAGDVNAPRIPYSTVSAIDSIPTLGPLLDDAGQPIGPLADDEIVLNSWAASDLNARPGDRIRLTWFEPETTHGKPTEQSAEFTLRTIARLTEPREGYRRPPPVYDERPTLVNDPDLTPTVEGVTDQESINDWDPPFPFDQKRFRPHDDDYWAKHRTTPKAFVSLAAGRKLWASRFGATTSVRVAARAGMTVESLERSLLAQFERDGQRLGLDVRPIKQQALDAARGTTPFDALFLSLSFFVIVAALLLVALLFRLGLEQRATEIGVLLALGWNNRRVARLFAWEGACVSLLGGLAGVALGIGYAWLMLVGLSTWWLGAIATPFLTLHVTPLSLCIGYASGVVVATIVNGLGLRALRKSPVRPLLGGRLSGVESYTRASRRRGLTGAAGRWFIAGFGLCAVGGLAAGVRLVGQAQAGAFVAAGMALLSAILLGVWRWFAAGPTGDTTAAAARLSLRTLAARNAGRNPLRSTLTIGLVAAACFLIVAMSAFRLDPTESGSGGYSLVAQSSQPIFDDLNDPETRLELWSGDAEALDGTRIDALRMLPGDDASCGNLYQATQPRVLGVPPSLIDHFDEARPTNFTFAASALDDSPTNANPWRLLTGGSVDGPIPVILDQNTALYSLHLYGGIGQEFDIRYPSGTSTFRVVGLLSNSVLQGSLLVSESRFVRAFPEVSGYQYFLVRTPADRVEPVTRLLESRLGDQGFDATGAAKMLADFLAVQNTYLSTFQSLGALGLLLGTFGLATVQMRNVLERRGELALLRAAGFARRRLASLVMLEHVLLLVGGMVTGVIAAAVAVLPFVQFSGSSAPLAELAAMLATILGVGLLSGVAAVRTTLRAPLIGALRGD